MTVAEVTGSDIGLVVQALTAIAVFVLAGVQLMRAGNGKDGERQVEPTALHAIQSELKAQTTTLNKLDRESGETKTALGGVKEELQQLRKTHAEESEKMFRRINAISTESTETRTRVDILERRS